MVREIDLGRRVAHTPKPPQQWSNPKRLGDGPREERSLIIPACTTPPPVQRHRHDRVDLALPATRVVGHDRPKHGTELTSAVVLEALDRVRDGSAILVNGAWVGDLVAERKTCGAKDDGALARFIAAGATRRCDQTQKPMKKIAHMGVSVSRDRSCRVGVAARWLTAQSLR
jgi:hypothetical protein